MAASGRRPISVSRTVPWLPGEEAKDLVVLGRELAAAGRLGAVGPGQVDRALPVAQAVDVADVALELAGAAARGRLEAGRVEAVGADLDDAELGLRVGGQGPGVLLLGRHAALVPPPDGRGARRRADGRLVAGGGRGLRGGRDGGVGRHVLAGQDPGRDREELLLQGPAHEVEQANHRVALAGRGVGGDLEEVDCQDVLRGRADHHRGEGLADLVDLDLVGVLVLEGQGLGQDDLVHGRQLLGGAADDGVVHEGPAVVGGDPDERLAVLGHEEHVVEGEADDAGWLDRVQGVELGVQHGVEREHEAVVVDRVVAVGLERRGGGVDEVDVGLGRLLRALGVALSPVELLPRDVLARQRRLRGGLPVLRGALVLGGRRGERVGVALALVQAVLQARDGLAGLRGGAVGAHVEGGEDHAANQQQGRDRRGDDEPETPNVLPPGGLVALDQNGLAHGCSSVLFASSSRESRAGIFRC